MWLVFDASSALAVVGLFDAEGKLLAETSSSVRAAHGEALLVLIDEVLRRAGLRVRDLAGLVVGRGPGSFTGIRVALATALGLRRARPLPILTVTSFEALANGGQGALLVTVPALPGEVYAEPWDDGAPSGEALVLAEDALPLDRRRVQGALDVHMLWRAARGKAPSESLQPCYVAPAKISLPKPR